MNYTFQRLETFRDATILHHLDAERRLWATGRRDIILFSDGQRRKIARFPFSFPRDLFAWSRPAARLFRSDKCNLYANRFGNLLGIRGGHVYAIEKDQVRYLFSIQGDCVLHRSLAEDQQGAIYFGEYFMNPERKPVRIWRVSPQLDAWEIAHQLPGIRHVHGIYRDPYHPQDFWVTVGDFEEECHILKTSDGFQSFEQLGDGSQTWRAVNLFFTREHVSWITDSNLQQNHACRLQRASHQLEIGQPLDASVWYGCTTTDGLHLAFTTIEQGPAIQSNASSVLVSSDAFNWLKVHAFKKDFWRPVKLFKYGVISCPSGQMSSRNIYLSGEGLVGLDGISIRASISPAS